MTDFFDQPGKIFLADFFLPCSKLHPFGKVRKPLAGQIPANRLFHHLGWFAILRARRLLTRCSRSSLISGLGSVAILPQFLIFR